MARGVDAEVAARAPRRGFLRCLFSRKNIVGFVFGGITGAALRLGPLPAAAAFVIGRWAYGHAEQRVPFTNRVHVILLPSAAEAALGAVLYEKFVAEQAMKRTLLDKNHPDTLLVTGVAQRLIAALGQGRGGGYQKHLRSFRWEVAVVNQPVMNAFVFPGGKICVYTGLLDLLRRDPDLLGMVMGHEIAHALARHSTEKMGMGLGISVAMAILQMALSGGGGGGGGGGDSSGGGAYDEAELRRRAEAERARRAYQRQYSRLVEGHEEEEEGGAHDHNHQQQQAAPNLGDEILKALSAGADAYGASAAAPAGPHVPRHYPAVPRPEAPGTGARYAKGRGVGAAQGPPQLPAWMSDQMVQSLTSVLLELPFSRRAETEADLIGLKLMALAGFNASKGPEAFKLLAQASHGDRRRHAGSAEALIAGLGCTHPNSNKRAEVLARELAWMAAQSKGGNAAAGNEAVGTKVDYWAL